MVYVEGAGRSRIVRREGWSRRGRMKWGLSRRWRSRRGRSEGMEWEGKNERRPSQRLELAKHRITEKEFLNLEKAGIIRN